LASSADESASEALSFGFPSSSGSFGFHLLEAVIVNKAVSLVVVTSGLIFRATVIPVDHPWRPR
jgi:hypothetical protein